MLYKQILLINEMILFGDTLLNMSVNVTLLPNKINHIQYHIPAYNSVNYPKYLGIILDRSPCYKQHIQNTKMKVAARNNLLTKLATFKWGINPSTIRMTALALSYSTAEYAAPVWARSPRAKNLDPGLVVVCLPRPMEGMG